MGQPSDTEQKMMRAAEELIRERRGKQVPSPTYSSVAIRSVGSAYFHFPAGKTTFVIDHGEEGPPAA